MPTAPVLRRAENIQQSTWLEWTPPQRAAGRLEYYEIAIIESDANNTLISQHFSYIGSQQNHTCVMTTPVCTPMHRFHYKVRAVNAEQLQQPQQSGEEVDEEGRRSLRFTPSQSQFQQCVAQLPLNDSDWHSIQLYQNTSLYRLHKSIWAVHEVSCSPERNNAKMLLHMLEAGISIVIIAVTFHIGYRKYQKMSDIDLVLPPGIMETLKKPIEIGSMGADSAGGGGGAGVTSGGISCTRVDTAPQYLPQYSPQDAPHDFNSGSESSKLLLANSSSGGGGGGIYDDHHQHHHQHHHHQHQQPVPPMSYNLLFDDESPNTPTTPGQATELHVSQSHQGGGGGAAANNTGYIKPTQMKNWTAANTLVDSSSPALPLNGYVPVQVLQQARNTQLPTATASPTSPASATPMHLLSSSNYVQASDLHKLKPMPPPIGAYVTPTAAAAAAASAKATAAPPLANNFGYTAMEQLQRNGLMKTLAPPAAATATQAAHTAQTTPGGQSQQLHRLQPQHIGGYVTPQDLNAIAHNRHMM